MKSKIKCNKCGKMAVWFYMPGNESIQYCEEHVPRGCRCNEVPLDDDWDNENPDNWVQELDEQGREFPCCEYMFYPDGVYDEDDDIEYINAQFDAVADFLEYEDFHGER